METTVKPVYGAKEAGCWFDNHRGVYMGEAIIDCAIDLGFDLSDCPLEDCKRYADHEFYLELWDSAEMFMAQFAADGYWFGSNESGDWGLWECEEE